MRKYETITQENRHLYGELEKLAQQFQNIAQQIYDLRGKINGNLEDIDQLWQEEAKAKIKAPKKRKKFSPYGVVGKGEIARIRAEFQRNASQI